MTIIVEDGTMPFGANSYASTAQASAYIEQRSPSLFAAFSAAEGSAREAALVRASDLVNTLAWKGEKVDPERVMSWPRKGMRHEGGAAIAENRVPGQICRAVCELAAWMLYKGERADPLAPLDLSRGPVVSESVDVLSVSYALPDESRYAGPTGHPAVDAMLRPFLKGKGTLEESLVGMQDSGRG